MHAVKSTVRSVVWLLYGIVVDELYDMGNVTDEEKVEVNASFRFCFESSKRRCLDQLVAISVSEFFPSNTNDKNDSVAVIAAQGSQKGKR